MNQATRNHDAKISGAYDDARAFGYAHKSACAFARAMAARVGVSARQADQICEEHAKSAGSIAGGREAGMMLA